MTAKPGSDKRALFAALPSVDELLRSETGSRLGDEVGRTRLAELARRAISGLRKELRAGTSTAETKGDLLRLAEARLASGWEMSKATGMHRVINATGVVIHTNLGRAPLSEAAKLALVNAAGYCNVEYDLTTGERGKRGQRVEAMICEVTGAEDALVVNNCAAAAYLVLTAFAAGGEVIISRGELVEIGGEFRVPDVLSRSGAILKEIGTTNRTKLADYEKALGEKTAMILKVHPSNYRIVGFTASPLLGDLADLAHRKNILLYEDAGSGALTDMVSLGLQDEPLIKESVQAGADIVTFSGDKLLGGPQAGVIVGNRTLIAKLRKDPLYRALRVGKLIYAALEATLDTYLRGTATDEVPVLKMLAESPEALEQRCWQVIERLSNSELSAELTQGRSAVGGGAAPMAEMETSLIVLRHSGLSADAVESRLREMPVPVVARIVDDCVVIDLRTVAPEEEVELVSALNNV